MFTLEQLTTPDGLIHQGILAEPEKSTGKAIVWVHGLTSTFYGNTPIIHILSEMATQQGIAFASFNTRGHDMITGMRKVDSSQPKGYTHVMGGGGYEVFTECIHDIDGVINFLGTKGYTKIVLMGHSTGANKVCFYTSTRDRTEVIGVILACPMSDRLDPASNKAQIEENLAMMKELESSGRGDILVNKVGFFPMTPKRYSSLFAPNSIEDQFDYGESTPSMSFFTSIKKPVMVIFAENDEYADRPISEIKTIFDRCTQSATYQSVIIPEAFHNLSGKEQDVERHIRQWIVSL